MPLPPYLAVAWTIGFVLLVGVIGAAIVEVAGKSRLGRWLRLDVRDDDR